MKSILPLSILLAAMIVTVSCIGLFTTGFYSRETLNWQAQSTGQDMFDLFLVAPVLLFTAVLAYRGKKSAALIWAGAVLYLIYTFLIYCFAVHFNSLFVIYCLILGLSFYSAVYFFHSLLKEHIISDITNTVLVKATGIYFIVIAVLFYFLWLAEIIPSITNNTLPKTLSDAGLFTNPVHVIDLSVVLPGIFMNGILLLKRKPLGFLLAPILLTFFILMDLTIAGLMIVMKQKGVEADLSIAAVMGMLALLSSILLTKFLSSRTN